MKARNVRKRPSAEDSAPVAKKRQRTKPAAKKKAESEPESSELSEPSDTNDSSDASDISDESDVSEKPAKKKRIGKPAQVAKRRQTKKPAKKKSGSEAKPSGLSESELTDLSNESEVSEKPVKMKRLVQRGPQKSKRTVPSDSEDEQGNEEAPSRSEHSEAKDKPNVQPQMKDTPKKNPPEKNVPVSEPPAAETDSPLSELDDQANDAKPSRADESSESEVFDEPPKRKGKSKESSTKPPSKSAKPTTAKAKVEQSPDDAEIKRLQGQLVKCGIRKIWAFELKQFGGDSRAKIRHLKTMLKDVGMDGRFSESKAREIKEQRELLADLEAVKEMNSYWGADGGRASRSRAAKPIKLKVDSSSDEDEEENAEGKRVKEKADGDGDSDEDGDMPREPRARALAKRRADFAFLGDEEESD